MHPASRHQTLSAAGQEDDDCKQNDAGTKEIADVSTVCRQLERDSMAVITPIEVGTGGKPVKDALDW